MGLNANVVIAGSSAPILSILRLSEVSSGLYLLRIRPLEYCMTNSLRHVLTEGNQSDISSCIYLVLTGLLHCFC